MFSKLPAEPSDLVKKAIQTFTEKFQPQFIDEIDIISFFSLKEFIDRCGLYQAAAILGVLVDNSAEEFMLSFMDYYNKYVTAKTY